MADAETSENSDQFLQPSLIAAILVTCLCAFWTSKTTSKQKKLQNLPPGPRSLPFVGYQPFITKEPYKHFVELSRQFKSNVIGFYLGNRYTVVLNDFPSIKEALLSDACLGRPKDSAFEILSESKSMNDVSGPYWRENRRTSLRILKDLGFDNHKMENQTKYEIQELVDVLKASRGQCFDFHHRLTSSVSNNITSLVFGERYDYDDKRRRLLDDYILTIGGFFNQTSIHAFFPWLKKTLYFFGIRDYDKAKHQLQNFLGNAQREIDAHKMAQEESATKDYIDGYLKSMKKDTVSTPYLNLSFLRGNMRSLFGAGTEPVRCTLEWCFLTMAHFKDYQARVHEELDRVVGRTRAPCMTDSTNTPLTTATVYEVMRWMGVVPFSHVRCAMEDTTIQGVTIPKDSVIMVNLYASLSDPTLWDQPETFRPERFINNEQKPFRPEFFIPFGLGKRSCPGENMVYIEMYVYFATIMQQFEILPPEGEKICFDFTLGIAKQSKSPRLRFTARVT